MSRAVVIHMVTYTRGMMRRNFHVALYLREWAGADELKALPISVGPINTFEPGLLRLAAKVLVQLLAL